MRFGWRDETTRHVCTSRESGVATWGVTGCACVCRCLDLLASAATVAELSRFKTLHFTLSWSEGDRVLVVRSRRVGVVGQPADDDGNLVQLPERDDMQAVMDTRNLYILNVRWDGRSASSERVA